ncbi:MAG: hypothetical protein U0M51_04400 [Eggerthellaceae bacterium]
MWEMQNQVKRLLERANMTLQEVCDRIDDPHLKVTRVELSRAVNSEGSLTPKQRKIIAAAHAVLTARLEQMNKETRDAIRRASKAVEESERLESLSR